MTVAPVVAEVVTTPTPGAPVATLESAASPSSSLSPSGGRRGRVVLALVAASLLVAGVAGALAARDEPRTVGLAALSSSDSATTSTTDSTVPDTTVASEEPTTTTTTDTAAEDAAAAAAAVAAKANRATTKATTTTVTAVTVDELPVATPDPTPAAPEPAPAPEPSSTPTPAATPAASSSGTSTTTTTADPNTSPTAAEQTLLSHIPTAVKGSGASCRRGVNGELVPGATANIRCGIVGADFVQYSLFPSSSSLVSYFSGRQTWARNQYGSQMDGTCNGNNGSYFGDTNYNTPTAGRLLCYVYGGGGVTQTSGTQWYEWRFDAAPIYSFLSGSSSSSAWQAWNSAGPN
jgi:hypothetical protein